MIWEIKSSNADVAARLASEVKIPLGIALLLVQRGISAAPAALEFLNPSLEQLHSPYMMLGMRAAVGRLQKAFAAKERILIYGDYDVDGTVAVVILKTCIELLGGCADFHVPHRIREGYGMKDSVIENAAAAGISLVISVDTGIRAQQEADTARRLGLDLIVTDHHLPEAGETLPLAFAVLNPNQPGCDYPCKDLCGAGVAFKVAQALLTEAGPDFVRLVPSFIKMAAIATIADSVSLTGENRAITKLGLDGLRHPVNAGLKALMKTAKVGIAKDDPITASAIAFRIAPRINAAGRMDIASDVVELFTSRDAARAGELAEKLNSLNADRQAEEARIMAQVFARLDADETLRDDYCLVIAGEGWHRGVIGIAATRVVERTGKPSLVIAIDAATGEAHGSARSIAAFHLLDALESPDCRKLFVRMGGHAHAAGFTMLTENISALKTALNRFARTRLTLEDFAPRLKVDAEIKLEDLNPEWMRCLNALEPFGMGNPEPVFVARGLRLIQPPRVLKDIHAKLRVVQPGPANNSDRVFDAMAWRMAEQVQKQNLVAGDILDIAFKVEENKHPDFGGLQLKICDLARTSFAVGETKISAAAVPAL